MFSLLASWSFFLQSSLTLALKKEIHFPYLEVEARLVPPFELPRRLQGRILSFRIKTVKLQDDLDIYDKDHAFGFEKGSHLD
jgi:hypothetical protein